MTELALELRQITKRFGGFTALDQVSINLPLGSITGLIGPNGAGKTTLFNIASGFISPDAGKVIILGQPATGLGPHQRCRLGLVRTFQNVRLFPEMTVLENVMVGRHRHGRTGFLSCMLRLPSSLRENEQTRIHAMAALDRIGISHLAMAPAKQVTFGQQRLIEIARALASEPKVLLLDEPSAGLNPGEIKNLVRVLDRLRSEGLSILLVAHDLSLMMAIAEDIYVLNFGQLIAHGPPDLIRNNPAVKEAYLGRET